MHLVRGTNGLKRDSEKRYLIREEEGRKKYES